jgi:hypothetical protein
MAQVIEHLPSNREALSSNPSKKKRKKEKKEDKKPLPTKESRQ